MSSQVSRQRRRRRQLARRIRPQVNPLPAAAPEPVNVPLPETVFRARFSAPRP